MHLMRNRHADTLEVVGVTASLICLLHCVALPLLVAALPALSTGLGTSETFHIWVLALAVPVSGAVLVAGRPKNSGAFPLILGLCGLALLVGGVITRFEAAETLLTIVGSLCLCVAHVANWRLRYVHYRA